MGQLSVQQTDLVQSCLFVRAYIFMNFNNIPMAVLPAELLGARRCSSSSILIIGVIISSKRGRQCSGSQPVETRGSWSVYVWVGLGT